MHAPSENIVSIKVVFNIKSFRKLGISQFTQLWVVTKHDFRKSLIVLTEYLKEHISYGLYSQSSSRIQYSFHLETLVLF